MGKTSMMFEFIARLVRIFWRPESECAGGNGVLLAFPAALPVTAESPAKMATAPVVFIRRTGEATQVAACLPKAASRHLSAQLQSVARLNPPSSRYNRGSALTRSQKPKPMAAPAELKRTASVKPGVVIGRLQAAQRRNPAAVINLAEVRAEVQRAKQIEATDMELVALFN